MAKVSIIVPIYNTEKYLKKCLNSLINQSEEDIEIILLNDGSTDSSEKIIKSYKDERIKYIKKRNTGIGSTRNMGIEMATGEFLMFIDSDDYISIDCVKKMYEKAKNDKCDIVVSDYSEDHGSYQIRKTIVPFPDTSLKDMPSLINEINLGPCNKIYKRSLFKDKENRFEEKLKYEDAPFVCKMFLNAKKIGKVNEYLSYYVIHEKSETTVRDERIFDILKISKIIIDYMSKYDYMKKALINLIIMILTDYNIQQRYIHNRNKRNEFIDKSFKMLDELDKNWKKCDYLYRFSFIKRFVKTNKFLTKLYCDIYVIMR